MSDSHSNGPVVPVRRRLSEMTSVVNRAGWLAVVAWPRLLAWFLLGWGLRLLAIRLAAFAAVHEPIWGMLILPLAVLARLGSYIAMFWVLRDALPGYRRLRARGEAGLTTAPTSAGGEVFAVAVLPFFTLYTAVKFLQEDFEQYTRWALANTNPFDQTTVQRPTEIGSGAVVVSLVVGAFLLRFLLKRLGERLPRWVSPVTLYLEALWVLLAVPVVWHGLVSEFPKWLSHRRAAVWFGGVRDTALSHAPAADWTYHAIGTAIGALIPVVSQPLAWLAVAGVIYSRAVTSDDPLGTEFLSRVRGGDRAKQRWERLHPVVRARSQELASDIMGRFKPLVTAARLIAQAGMVPIALYVFAYTVIGAAPAWLFLAINRLLGPHEIAWWMAINQPLDLLCSAAAEPLRVCVIAAAYDYCLRKHLAQEEIEDLVTDR